MKNIILFFGLFLCSVLTHAQTSGIYGQKVDLELTCNRSWKFNDSRFHKLIWQGIVEGALPLYLPGNEANQPLSVSEWYAQYRKNKLEEFEIMGLFDEPVEFHSRLDSIEVMSDPNFEISGRYQGNSDTVHLNKEWYTVYSSSIQNFGYKISYPQLIKYLDQKKGYWVNPFQSGDSILFSKALEEERYVFEWTEKSPDVKFYNGQSYAHRVITEQNFRFDGIVIRSASLADKANFPYAVVRPSGNVVSVLMSAFLSEKLQGYEPDFRSRVLYTADTYRQRILSIVGYNDNYSEEEVYDIPYREYESSLDMLSVSYYTSYSAVALFLPSKPDMIMISVSADKNYRGVVFPVISFDYNEAMEVLGKSGLMWYGADNHADSCSLATALNTNKVFWNSSSVYDRSMYHIYSCEYNAELKDCKIYASDTIDFFMKKFIDQTLNKVKSRMNIRFADQAISSSAKLPVYLRYKAVRVLNQSEDSTLVYLPSLSAYVMKKALDGQLTMYQSDSLNVKMSLSECQARMLLSYYRADEEGNSFEEVDTLTPGEINVVRVTAIFVVDQKGKLSMNDHALQFCIPGELSSMGIESPVVTLSYQELVLLMKKDKEGNKFLKQLDATINQKKYKVVYDPYGAMIYDSYSDGSREDRIRSVPSVMQPYLAD